jgi:CHAP domain
MTSEEFGTALVATARKYLYVRETNGNNSDNGHFIDASLAALGLPPGNSWCAAAICAWVKETQQTTGAKFKFRRSARAMGLWELNTDLRVAVADIQPGDILCWDHGSGLGHVAICTAAVKVNGDLASLDAVAGNTSADGHSRNGDRCAEHAVTYPDPKLVGGLRIVPS